MSIAEAVCVKCSPVHVGEFITLQLAASFGTKNNDKSNNNPAAVD